MIMKHISKRFRIVWTKIKVVKMNKNASRWIQAITLCYVNLINYMDRYTVSGVLEDVEKEFNMDQEWMGGLIQTAFIICYFIGAPAFGYLGDRYSRKWLIILGIVMWSSSIMVSSFMPSYWPFLIVRATMGLGECGFTVLAPTLLGDLFHGKEITYVLALFYFSIPVGSGLGYIVGSGVAQAAGDWRWGVRTTPFLAYIALIILVIFLTDPPRGHSAQLDNDRLKGRDSWKDDLIYLVNNKSFMFSSIGFTFLTFFTGGLSWWGPHFIEDALKLRNQTLPPDIVASDPSVENVFFMFGLIMAVAGVAGLTLGSGLSFWLRPKYRGVDPLICGGGLVPSSILILISFVIAEDNIWAAYILVFFGQVFLNMNWAVIVDMTLYVVEPTKRASAEAFQLMGAHAIGECLAPYLCGFITDAFQNSYKKDFGDCPDADVDAECDYKSWQKSFYIASSTEFIAAAFFLATACFVIKDWDKAIEDEKELNRKHERRVSMHSIKDESKIH